MDNQVRKAHLPFDPIERAGELWDEHFGDAKAMMAVTSVMRVQQLLIKTLDSALKPFGITFSRYEVLVLLSFSKRGKLPLSKIGERLMVHPTSVTNAIDRLTAQGLVSRVPDPHDRRMTLAALTDDGRAMTVDATAALNALDFGLHGLEDVNMNALFAVLRTIRQNAGDFPPDTVPQHVD
jgi:DNA-binding MarR family transcriptional regulator